MKVRINGEETELEHDTTVAALLAHLGLSCRRVAVELNRSVVARAEWPATLVRDDDHIEIVQFVGGG